jgi:hypothetical protein
MKENSTYKIIRGLLQKTSLRPKKSDWEKMNALLDQHLPGGSAGSGSGAGTGGLGAGPFNFTIPIIVGVVIIVVATVIAFSSHIKTDKAVRSGEIPAAKGMVNAPLNNKIAVDQNKNNTPQDGGSEERSIVKSKTDVNTPDKSKELSKAIVNIPNKSEEVSKTLANIPNKSEAVSKTGMKLKNTPDSKIGPAANTDNAMKASNTETHNNEKFHEKDSGNNRNRGRKSYLTANSNYRSTHHSHSWSAAA